MKVAGMKIAIAGLAALFAASAAGCGRMADLEAPPARKTERSQRSAQAPGLPEPATVYRPPSTQPIDGGPNTSPYSGSGARPN
jgi:predicted small lipoprotein YifL